MEIQNVLQEVMKLNYKSDKRQFKLYIRMSNNKTSIYQELLSPGDLEI